jgi:hypothetical protein
MRPLNAHTLLRIWEIGQHQHPIDRALTLLAVACPEKAMDELVSLSIGQRDAHLLTLRELTFGSQLNGFVTCPHCSEQLEFSFSTANVRVTTSLIEGVPPDYSFTTEGFDLRFRLPNSQDLAALVPYESTQGIDAASHLAQRCLIQAMQDGTPIPSDELPATVITQLADQIVEHDPQAEVLIGMNCAACGHAWQALFDILDFFWIELSTQAKRLLQEVHLLARFYGWREADILSMSAARRQIYLNFISDG